jgi:DNA polymerase
MDKEKELKAVKEDVLNCKKCPLYKTRIWPVIGEGSHQAKIMFVGEAPGAREDKAGRLFCGMAGKILDKLLNSAGIKREDVYIANILKCRPPRNRDPKEEEISVCVPYLERQIGAIKPQVICPLGRYSMYFLMKKFGLEEQIQPISKIHGNVFKAKQGLFLIPFYHPAVLAYNSNMKKYLIEDFRVLEKLEII